MSLLSESHLTSAEHYFLIQRLSYPTETEARNMLVSYYGHTYEVVVQIERRILLRLSPQGIERVRAWLDGTTPDDPECTLSPVQYGNVKSMVEMAAFLQAKAARAGEQPPVSVAPLLGDRSKAAAAPEKETRQPAPPPPAIVKQPVTPLTDPVPAPLADLRLPAHEAVAKPEALLELVWLLHGWLSEQPRTTREMIVYLNRAWRLRQENAQDALDLLYALGMITRTKAQAGGAQVMPSLPADLNIARFRLACAEAFAVRLAGNDRLLLVLDRLGSAPVQQLGRLVFGDARPLDLPARLLVWEALGIAERGRKETWRITQAGRALVAKLPPLAITIEDETVSPALVKPDHDWLDTL